MRYKQIFAFVLSALGLFVFLHGIANAGWFGPSDYNECMLEGMKALPGNMTGMMADKCVKGFCSEDFKRNYNQCRQTFDPIFCLSSPVRGKC
jgi:hypothetical protein